MAENQPFAHLSLVQRYQGPARFPPGGDTSPTTDANKVDRGAHRRRLRASARAVVESWKGRIAQRDEQLQEVLPEGIPLLLQIDPSFDLEDLQALFQFEVVSEQEDGFVIVVAEDVELGEFLRAVDAFSVEVRGATNVAKLHQLHEDQDLSLRLQRLLSEDLLARWPNLQDADLFVCDFGVSCTGTAAIPPMPKRRARETDQDWARRDSEWNVQRQRAYDAWDDLMSDRIQQMSELIRIYDGEILNIVNDPHGVAELQDSFTLRIRINGKGLRDIALNFPYLFEVTEPDEIETPQRLRDAIERAREAVELRPPPADAPAVCVIDSGVQEEHYLLAPAIDRPNSSCFLPDRDPTDVADYVRPGGHGTRVAGAVLYGERVPVGGVTQLSYWIQNARVLDDDCKLPETLFPPSLMRAVVEKYNEGPRSTRIFNHSISATVPCRKRHMSAWAAEIDYLSYTRDVLFIQSAGNIFQSGTATRPGITEHLAAGRAHPEYLSEDACRIANPAQSLQALTVGSVAYEHFEGDGWRSIAQGRTYPSAFTRCGPGIWDTIKPEVVEFGGDHLKDTSQPPNVSTPTLGSRCYPELVRSTRFPPGPAHDRDVAGTSFAAPKVARIAATLQEVLPEQPCLLYRALIVQSARWPGWALDGSPELQAKVLRWIGYGIPDAARASSNSEHRTTLVTDGERAIKPGECHIFQVPMPAAIRGPADEYQVLIEVTLSFSARPRRTRRRLARYLSVWADWQPSRIDESLEGFRDRLLREQRTYDGEGQPMPWVLAANPIHGAVRGVSRNLSTVQKDWTVVASNQLPENFCIAVRGHKGWSKDPDATARYSLAVSFELLGKEISIYEQLRAEVEELQSQVREEVEAQVESLVDGGQ